MNLGNIVRGLNVNLLETVIPDKIPEADYFLKEINTPIWIWGIRISFCLALVFVLVTYIHYERKDKKTKDKKTKEQQGAI